MNTPTKKTKRLHPAKKLAKLRAEMGINQTNMGKLLRCPTTTLDRQVRRWENEESEISGPVSLLIDLLTEIKGTELGRKYGFE